MTQFTSQRSWVSRLGFYRALFLYNSITCSTDYFVKPEVQNAFLVSADEEQDEPVPPVKSGSSKANKRSHSQATPTPSAVQTTSSSSSKSKLHKKQKKSAGGGGSTPSSKKLKKSRDGHSKY